MKHWLRVMMMTQLWAPLVSAQYEEPRDFTPSPARYAAFALTHRDFAPRSTNTLPDSQAIASAGLMPMVMFHQGQLDIAFGYTTYSLRGVSRAAIFFGATFTNEFPLAGKRPGVLILPLVASADFTKSENTGLERDHFNIASVGIGTGLKYRWQGETVEAGIEMLSVFHYSFEGLSTGSGSSLAVLGNAVLQWKNVPVFDGLAVGYRFRYQQWSLSQPRFDYRLVSHGPFLGLMF